MKNKYVKIPFLAGAKYKNKIYFSSLYVNGLFEYDCSTRVCKYLMKFDEKYLSSMLHRKAAIFEDQIWFMPWEASKIVRYDITNNQLFYYDVGCKEGALLYFDYARYDNMLYFIPYEDNISIAVIDEKHNTVNLIDGISEETHIAGAGYYNNKLLLASQTGNLLIKNLKNNILEKVINTGINTKEFSFLTVIDAQKTMVLCPFTADKIVIIDKANETVVNSVCFNDGRYSYGKNNIDTVTMYPTEFNRFIMVIDKNLKIEYKRLELDLKEDFYLEMMNIDYIDGKTNLVTTNEGSILEYDDEWNLIQNYKTTIDRDDYNLQLIKNFDRSLFATEANCVETNNFDLDTFLKIML